MTVIPNYLQLLGLNIMLILISSGFVSTAYVTYIVTITIGVIMSIVQFEIMNNIMTGKLPRIHEMQFVSSEYPDQVYFINVYSTIIHCGLAFFLLNSIVLPLLMIGLLILRKRSSNKFKEALCHH